MTLRISLPESRSPTGLLDERDELLDQFVAEYEREIENARPELPHFFFSFIPSRTMREALTTHPARLQREGLLRVNATTCYYGGIFVRQELRSIQLEKMLTLPGIPIERSAFDALAREAQAGADAAVGSTQQALEYLEGTIDDLAGMFARVLGGVEFMLSLGPGAGATDALVPGGLLWCGYREPRLPAVAGLYGVSHALEHDPDPRWRKLGDRIQAIQVSETDRDVEMWRETTEVLVDSVMFEQLLLMGAAYTECLQAAALLSARALVYRDGATARAAALATAIVLLGNKTYSLGLMDNTFDTNGEALPKFIS